MKRTSKALARLGTGGLAAAVVLTVAPFATGTAFAAGPTASSTNGNTAPVGSPQSAQTSTTQGTVTLTDGTAGDTITASIAGTTTAYFPPTASQAAGVTVNAAGTTATCAATCTVKIDDTVSETANLNITETGTTPGTTTASVSFDGVFFSNCSQSGVNTTGNCVTQGTTNTPLPLTVTLLEAGTGAANRIISLMAPAGTALTGTGVSGGPSPTAYTCTTDANGKCTFNVVTPNATVQTITANFAGDANYPAATASESVTFSSGSVTPGRLDLVSSTLIAPSPVAAGQPAEPGEVIQNVYRVFGACTPAAGANNCTGTPLANQSVSLSVDHGFFTPNCTSGAAAAPAAPPTLSNNNYSSCSFNATPTAGTKVGDIKSSGTTETVTSDSNGYFIASLGIAKDAAFDSEGFVLATVTATSGGATLTPQQPGNTNTSAALCTQGQIGGTTFTPATEYYQPAQGGGAGDVNTANAGCHVNSLWTTRALALNGGSAKFLVIPPVSATAGTSNPGANNVTATDSGTNNVPDVDRVVFIVNKTDQFGNLTNDGGAYAGDTITKTGAGNILTCTGSSSTNACTGGAAIAGTAQPNGTTTQTVQDVPSYTDPGTLVRYEADAATAGSGNPCYWGGIAGNPCSPGSNDGTETVSLSWRAPATTFTAYAAGTSATGAFATYSAAGATQATALTDTLTLNLYNQLANLTVTLGTTPSNTVKPGDTVTVTTTVKDQFGNPVVSANYNFNVAVNFVRSGSNESSCVPTQTGNNNGNTALDSNGTAGFTFSCNVAGASKVTAAVVGPSNTQLAQGSTIVNFQGSAPVVTKKTVHAHIVFCKSPSKHHIRCKVQVSPHFAGLQVTLRSSTGKFLGTQRTNHLGLVTISHGHLKSHSKVRVHARVAGSGKTKPANSNTVTVRIK
jgi:hypothetical protein